MSLTKKRTVTAAVVVGVISGFLTTLDLISQIFSACFAFALILGVLLLLIRIFPVAEWSSVKQRTVVWLVGAVVGVSCALFFGPALFRALPQRHGLNQHAAAKVADGISFSG